MKPITKSIRWRLQLWLGFLLLITLCGFGVATYEANRIKQTKSTDEELKGRFEPLARAVRFMSTPQNDRNGFDQQRGGPQGNPPDAPPFDDGGPGRREPPFNDRGGSGPRGGGPPKEFGDRPAPNDASLSPDDIRNGYYLVVWNGDGSQLKATTNAPVDLKRPDRVGAADSGPHYRTRETFREAFDYNLENRCVLLGRSTKAEFAGRRALLWILFGSGGAVLALGLGGGWWITTRALRPIHAISSAATHIADGNLAERINVSETDDELGQLAATLNTSFARLESSFEQQRRFTADASHELRTPLAVMISEAQTTLAHPRTAEEYRETVEACLDTAQQMRRLTESLLELARLDSSQQQTTHEAVNLADIARASIELTRPLADKSGIRLQPELSAAYARGNAGQLGQVVTNLITNAINYNRPDGEVHIRTWAENGKIILSVADNGIGMDSKDLPHIFERFYRGDKARSRAEGRTGLGLAICKSIIDAHAGEIKVSSQAGEGTLFTVFFKPDLLIQ